MTSLSYVLNYWILAFNDSAKALTNLLLKKLSTSVLYAYRVDAMTLKLLNPEVFILSCHLASESRLSFFVLVLLYICLINIFNGLIISVLFMNMPSC